MNNHSLLDYTILFFAAALGGGVNAVAGGGTLLTFPSLYAILGPVFGLEASVIANATSTVALFPGSVGGAWGFREDLKKYRAWVRVLLPPSLVGGLVGALLLVTLPADAFDAAVPWLILTAAGLFSLQPHIAKWFGIGQAHAAPARGTIVGVVLFQFLVGIYGGYFGAGIGILMLSALAIMGLTDIHSMNGLKNVLGATINGIAVAVFIWNGTVYWPVALLMAVGAGVGGVAAAKIAKRIDRKWVRRLVITIGYSLAAYYFYKQFVG